jgi:carboxylesterase
MPELFNPLVAPFELEGTNEEAVVLLHGFTGTPAVWRLLAPILHAEGYTVKAPLLAGHGTTVEDMALYSGDDWLASARAAVTEVSDHRRVHLVGLSLGGLLAILLAVSSPSASLITINAPVRFRDPRIYSSPFLYLIRSQVIWANPESPPLDEEARPLWLGYPGFPTKRGGDLVAISRRALKAARRLRRPALVVQSRTDESVDPASGRILQRALGRRADLLWLDDCRHNALLDGQRHLVHQAVLRRIGTA